MTPREPDRFDAQGLEWMENILSGKWGDVDIAAALRAEHAEARAIALDEAHSIAYEANAEDIADQIEQLGALIPPAAAPECEWRCDACGDELASETAQRRHEATWHAAAAPAAEPGHGKLRHWNADGVLCPECFPEAPAAETGKAQGAEAGNGEGAAEHTDALFGMGPLATKARALVCPVCSVPPGEMCCTLGQRRPLLSIHRQRVDLAARAATSEREGT